MGPAPPVYSGIHRYQVFVYEQKEDNVELASMIRSKFDLMNWLHFSGVLCGPVASIGYHSEF